MSHEIFGRRFFGYRSPAWHRIGNVVHEEKSAIEALDLMGGYDVTKQPIWVETDDDILEVPGREIIMRHPTHDDPQYRFWGDVSESYQVITPREFAERWDTAIGQPVETMGAIKQGKIMFVTCNLPTFDIRGDEVKNYLVAQNGMDGTSIVKIRQTPVRVVCQNTLAYSEKAATEQYKITHTSNTAQMFSEWLADMWERQTAQSAALQEVFDVLAGRTLSRYEVNQVLDDTYRVPARPEVTAPPETMKVRYEKWERDCMLIKIRRNGALSLYEGDMTGGDTPAVSTPNGWRLYNAIVEAEDYSNGGSDEAAASALLTGSSRQARKVRGLNELTKLV